MIIKSIIFQIFIRFLKEKNILYYYQQFLDKNQFQKLITGISNNKVTTFKSFFKPQYFHLKNKGVIEEKIQDTNLTEEFHRILVLVFENTSKNFLIKHGLWKRFIQNLYTKFQKYPENPFYITKTNVHFYANDIFKWYINYLMKIGGSPLDLIICGFSWFSSNEKSDFWLEVHKKYVKHMWDIFLNTHNKNTIL